MRMSSDKMKFWRSKSKSPAPCANPPAAGISSSSSNITGSDKLEPESLNTRKSRSRSRSRVRLSWSGWNQRRSSTSLSVPGASSLKPGLEHPESEDRSRLAKTAPIASADNDNVTDASAISGPAASHAPPNESNQTATSLVSVAAVPIAVKDSEQQSIPNTGAPPSLIDTSLDDITVTSMPMISITGITVDVTPGPAPTLAPASSTQDRIVVVEPEDNQILTSPSSLVSMAVQPSQLGLTGKQGNKIIDLSQKLWETAFIGLDDSDRELLHKHIASLTSNLPPGTVIIIDGLVQSVEERKNEIERNRGGILQFSWKGRVFNLMKVLDDIVSWADRFKAIGDTIAQYDPGHMALPWAAAKFLLQIMTEDRANMAAITITIERVTNVSTLSAIYVGMYLDNRILKPVVYNRLEASLIKLHGTILSIIARAVRYLKHRRSAVRSLFEYGSFEDQLRNIDQNLEELRDDVHIAEREIMNLNYMRQRDNYERLKSLLHGLGNTLAKLERSAEALETDMRDKKRNDLLTWISPCPYKRHHRDVLRGETIMDNTGQWLFDSDDFRDWVQAPEGSLFWLNGAPGVGKSHLMYAAIELLQKSSKSYICAYFYCSRRDNDKLWSDPEAIIRALLKALVIESEINPESISLESRFKNRTDHGQLGLKEAEEYIINLLKKLKLTNQDRLFIFIDAVDEVEEKDRSRLLASVGEIFAATPSTRIWISSRPESDITRELMVKLRKKLDKSRDKTFEFVRNVAIAKRNKGEIARYIEREINARIEDEDLLDGDVDDETKRLIIGKLAEKGDGMYLWVRLQIASLCNLTHPDYIHERLEKLPEGLDETYSVLYHKIQKLDQSDQGNALNILKWLCVTTPLKFNELVELVKHTNTAYKFNAPLIKDIKYLQRICHNLVAIDHQQQEVQLVHLSAREFLEKEPRFESIPPHEMALRTCLNHLVTTPSSCPLMPYIVQNWTCHYKLAIRASGRPSDLFRLTRQFLQLKKAHQKWLEELHSEDLVGGLDPLFTISRYNLHELWQDVCQDYTLFDVIPKSCTATSKQTPLHLAVKFGHLEMVEFLVDDSAEALVDVNAVDQDGRTPLILAILLRNHTSIEVLLQCIRIDLNIPDRSGGFPPLVRAAWLGDEETVGLLLGTVNVSGVTSRLVLEATDDLGRTAIHWAVSRRSTGMLGALIAAGANINLQDRISRSTPVYQWVNAQLELISQFVYETSDAAGAVLEKHLEIGKLLCSQPTIDVGLRTSTGISPIGIHLSYYGTTAGQLFEGQDFPWKGDAPDVESNDEPNRKYVYFILRMKRDLLKCLLLAKSIDLNAPLQLPFPGNALHSAAELGRPETLEILLNHEAAHDGAARLNVNAINTWEGKTALHIAVEVDLKLRPNALKCLELLVNPKYGFDLRALDHGSKTPLQRAVLKNQRQYALILIQAEGSPPAEHNLAILLEENWEKVRQAAEESHESVLQLRVLQVNNPNERQIRNRRNSAPTSEEQKSAQKRVCEVIEMAMSLAGLYDDQKCPEWEAQFKEFTALDINVKDLTARTALHYLCDYDLCADESTKAKIYNCTSRKKLRTAWVLLDIPEIELNALDSFGFTAFYHACLQGDYLMISVLLRYRYPMADEIDVNLSGDVSNPPIAAAFLRYCQATSERRGVYEKCCKSLVEDGRVNLNVGNTNGRPMLAILAKNKTAMPILHTVLKIGQVDPNLRSTEGRTALMYAVDDLNCAAIKLLLKYPGVDIDCPDHDSETALTLAARNGDVLVMKTLLRGRPNLFWKNYRGQTAMDIAVEAGSTKIVELLNVAMDGGDMFESGEEPDSE